MADKKEPPLYVYAVMGGSAISISATGKDAEDLYLLLVKMSLESPGVRAGSPPPALMGGPPARRASSTRTAIMREQLRWVIDSGLWVPEDEPIPEGGTIWTFPERGFFSPQWEQLYRKLVEDEIIPKDDAVPPKTDSKPKKKKP